MIAKEELLRAEAWRLLEPIREWKEIAGHLPLQNWSLCGEPSRKVGTRTAWGSDSSCFRNSLFGISTPDLQVQQPQPSTALRILIGSQARSSFHTIFFTKDCVLCMTSFFCMLSELIFCSAQRWSDRRNNKGPVASGYRLHVVWRVN